MIVDAAAILASSVSAAEVRMHFLEARAVRPMPG